MDRTERESILRTFPSTYLIGELFEYDSGDSGANVVAAEFKRCSDGGLDGPCVVKFGTRTWAIAERRLCDELVTTPLMPLIARAVSHTAIREDQAALAYEMAFMDVTRTRTLFSLVTDGAARTRIGRRCIKQLANAVAEWIVATAIPNRDALAPFELLVRSLGQSRMHDIGERLKQLLPEWDQEAMEVRIKGLTRLLPNPLAYLKEDRWQTMPAKWACPIGPIHGDPHSGNIICLPVSKVVPKLIDFGQFRQHANPFFDLAYLEMDIVQRVVAAERDGHGGDLLPLLEFSTMEPLPRGLPEYGYMAERAWSLIRPIREEVRGILGTDHGAHEQAFEVAWWMAMLAAGLNIARKRRLMSNCERCARMSALIYASYSLQRLLTVLGGATAHDDGICPIDWPPASSRSRGGRGLSRTSSAPQPTPMPAKEAGDRGAVETSSRAFIVRRVPQSMTPDADAWRADFNRLYADLLRRVREHPCAVAIWTPTSSTGLDFAALRQELRLAFSERMYYVVDAGSQAGISRWIEQIGWTLAARYLVMPVEDDPGVLLEARAFLEVLLEARTSIPAAARVRIFVLLSRQSRGRLRGILSRLTDHFADIYWYDASTLDTRRAADTAIVHAEAQRMLAVLREGGSA